MTAHGPSGWAGPAWRAGLTGVTSLAGLVLSLPALAQAPVGGALVSQARERGCESHASAGRLQTEARLNQAAARLARGQTLEAALAAEGYRAERAAVVALRGLRPAQLGEALARHVCPTLVDVRWSQVGVAQQDQAAWVL